MHAYLIDPFTRTIEQVPYSGHYSDIYRLTQCDTFTVVGLPRNDALYIDDEGLLCDLTQQAFFRVAGYPTPLAGRGLILGTDDEGDTTNPKLTIEDIRHAVTWTDLGTIAKEYNIDQLPDEVPPLPLF